MGRTSLNTKQLGVKTVNIEELDDDVTTEMQDRVHTINGKQGDVILDVSNIVNAVSINMINIPSGEIVSNELTIHSISPVVIETFDNAGSEYMCLVSYNSEYQLEKTLVIFDGIQIYANYYGQVLSNDLLGSFDFDVVNNIARLIFTPNIDASMIIKTVRTSFI